MRKILFAFLTFFIFRTVILGQAIVENPEKPASKNPGRVIQLKEVLRIKDEGREFYFKEPWGIDVAEDGSIFVQDGVKLYKFDAQGKFKKNMVTKGQGPGEITEELTDFVVDNNDIIIFCGPMQKIVKKDLEGNFIKDLVLEKKRAADFIAYYNNKYFLVDIMPKSFERKEGFNDFDQNLFIFDEEGNATSIPYSFPIKHYDSFKGKFGFFQFVTTLLKSRVCQHFIYLSHTENYLIKQFDLEKLQIRKIFRRAYPRVRFQSDEMRPFKYYNDVHRLLIFRNNVWVLTSFLDKKKGILVDVFNEDGKYLDNFYLPLLNSKTGDCFYQLYFPMTIKSNFLYAVEHDEDWNYFIAKYEIID
jgi:hypothetical protein